MERIDLVVPAELVAGLRIPALAVTTGGADPEWADVPLGRWRFQSRLTQRLPLDPESASRLRRYVRFSRYALPVTLVATAAMVGAFFTDGVVSLVAGIVAVLLSLVTLGGGEVPDQTPTRLPSGDLRVPRVPVEVARQWVEQNPGVLATDQPSPRPRGRLFYAAWSAGLLTGAVVLSAAPAGETVTTIGVPLLFISGLALALKILPPGFIAFERPET